MREGAQHLGSIPVYTCRNTLMRHRYSLPDQLIHTPKARFCLHSHIPFWPSGVEATAVHNLYPLVLRLAMTRAAEMVFIWTVLTLNTHVNLVGMINESFVQWATQLPLSNTTTTVSRWRNWGDDSTITALSAPHANTHYCALRTARASPGQENM